MDGALVIAETDEMALNNMTLDYMINDNGTCTCKLCGEVTASRTHWYRHKYKVKFKSDDVQTQQYFSFRCIMSVSSVVINVKYSSKVRKDMKVMSRTGTPQKFWELMERLNQRRKWKDLIR